MLGTLILIFQIIGALPEVIETIQYIFKKIKEIRDRRAKKELKKELWNLMLSQKSVKTMSKEQNEMVQVMLSDIDSRVNQQLLKERGNV